MNNQPPGAPGHQMDPAALQQAAYLQQVNHLIQQQLQARGHGHYMHPGYAPAAVPVQAHPAADQPGARPHSRGSHGRASRPGSAASAGSSQRKRKRGAAPEPAAAAAVAAAEYEHAEGEEEGPTHTDSEAEEEEGVPQELPPPVDPKTGAVELLKAVGVTHDRAMRALEHTEEQCQGCSAADWAEEAQFWLACHAELEEETDQLRQAMQVSLVEAEEQRRQETPLEERSAEEIIQAFSNSHLLSALRPVCSLAALLAPGQPLRCALLRYLKLEKNCDKWYSISRHYFRRASAECAQQAGVAEGSEGGEARAGDSAGQPATSSRRSARSASRQQQQQQPGGDPGGTSAAAGAAAEGECSGMPPPLPAAQAEALAAHLSGRCEVIEKEVYAMPSGDGAAVPQLFLSAAEEASDEGPECIELE